MTQFWSEEEQKASPLWDTPLKPVARSKRRRFATRIRSILATKTLCDWCEGDGYELEPNPCTHCHGTGFYPLEEKK